MDKDILQRYFFVTSLFLVTVLIFFIFLPLLEVLILSTIFAVVLNPLHRKLTKELNNKSGFAALIVIVLFAIIIIVPTFFLVTNILSESRDLYFQLANRTEADSIDKITELIETPVQNFFPSFTLDVGEYVSSGTDMIVNHFSSIVTSVFNIVTAIVLIFISLFFFLRDGTQFKKILVGLSPLDNKYDEHIFSKVKLTIVATVKGVLLVAIVQGILAGIGLWLFGVPNPTLWGSVSAVASLVPGLGTAIVFIPAVVYMFIQGNTFFAIGLLLWGFVIVGLVDNFLTPYLYSRGVEINPLIMLFAVLGGLSFFGPIGFIFGPIIVALFFSLIEIYQTIILGKNI